jgi:hypothetical protein
VAVCALRLGGLEGHQALPSAQAALSESCGVRSDGAALGAALAAGKPPISRGVRIPYAPFGPLSVERTAWLSGSYVPEIPRKRGSYVHRNSLEDRQNRDVADSYFLAARSRDGPPSERVGGDPPAARAQNDLRSVDIGVVLVRPL